MKITAAAVLTLGGLVALRGPAIAAIKVACVGDSITAGAKVTKGNDYPAVLGRLLGPAYEVRNFGNSGKTLMGAPAAGAAYRNTPTFPASKAFAPDIVVIMLGTNDAKAANWRGGDNTYEADYRAMIAEYAALPSKPRIHLALPPPALAESFTISPAVVAGEILPIVRRVAAAARVGLIDVNGAFRPDAARYFGPGDGAGTGDGVHPNDAGAALIARTVARSLSARPDGGADRRAQPKDRRAPAGMIQMLRNRTGQP